MYSTKDIYFFEIPGSHGQKDKRAFCWNSEHSREEGTLIVRSFIIQRQHNLYRRFFPITLSHIFPPPSSACLAEDTVESRTKKDRRGANENNKEWFFPSRRANPRDPIAVSTFPVLFPAPSDFFHILILLVLYSQGKILERIWSNFIIKRNL